MSTNLVNDVPALQRAVAVPGTFATLFPDTSDDDLLFTLLDGFAEAQLDGFFVNFTSDDLGVVTEDLARSERALVVLYASTRMLQNEIRNRKTHKRYEATGTVFEEDQSAQMLVELLKEYQQQKKDIRDLLRRGTASAAFAMSDAYIMKAVGDYWCGGIPGPEAGHWVAPGAW